MEWRKQPNLHFTDLCIYVDENIPKIADKDRRYPEIEDKVYNYLWLVVKALAIKKCMFNDFKEYDNYAFYAANRLFFALRKNYQNQGKTIKGKEIKPIKSCLNYMKALLYPMKIEYQNETYKEIISEEFISKKFDSYAFREKLRDAARDSQGVTANFIEYLKSSLGSIDTILDRVLKKSPFTPKSLDHKKLKLSLILNTIYSLKNKKKLDANVPSLILWKLPKSMTNYVRVLLKEFYVEIKQEIIDCYKSADINDELADRLLKDADGEAYQHYEE